METPNVHRFNSNFFNMRENHDWVDNKLERRYGTTQYNLAIQDYINNMEPFDIFDNINYDNDYITYRTPFFGEAYYEDSTDNEFAIEDNIMDNDEEYIKPRSLIMEFDKAEIEYQNMDIQYDNIYFQNNYL